MSLHIKKLEIPGFEEVVEVKNSACGLHAFIAVHDTTFGPSLGGIRFLPYSSREEALTDVLRLAEGMTYKSVLAGLKVGGGKSTVILNPTLPKPAALLHSLGEAINYLGGRYIGAEDMNCSLSDVSTMNETTQHILGLPGEKGTGDPARFTAHGVFIGIKATSQYLWGTPSLVGKKILIQGIGGVGRKLLEALFWAGADLFISELNTKLVQQVAHDFGAQIVDPSKVYDFECDIFVPCALGGILNSNTIPKLRCRAVVGAANNQLLTAADGKALADRNILYAPDYVVNAGGVIDVASAIDPRDTHAQKVLFKTEQISDRLLEVYQLAESLQACTSATADQLAQKLIAEEKERKNVLV